MANQVSLLTYLQQAPPHIHNVGSRKSSSTTTNPMYGPSDISSITEWAEFNSATIMQEYGQLLNIIQIENDPIRAVTPPRGINSKDGLQCVFGEYFHPRIRRSLRAAFQHLDDRDKARRDPQHQDSVGAHDQLCIQVLNRVLDHQLPSYTPVLIGVGSDALTPDKFTPDCSFRDATLPRGTLGPNRLPGDLKPSRKWSYNLIHTPLHRNRFYNSLAQVNWYMKQHRSQFSFILTEKELVPIHRLNNQGGLRLAKPIPWTRAGTAQDPELTVALGIWYLGILAADKSKFPIPW